MKQILVSSTLLWNATLEEMFGRVYECGVDGIELWAQQFFAKGYQEEEYLRLAALYPIHTYVHSSSWDLNLASMNEGIRRASVKEVIASMQLASRLGAFEVTVHPGHMTLEANRGDYVRWMRESLKEIAEASRRLGVDVSLELMEKIKKEFVVDLNSMRAVTGDLFDFFYYTVDLAHCDSEEEAFYMLEHLKRISKIHISNRAGTRLHTPLDEGDYDFRRLLPRLFSYKIPVVVEGYDCGRDFNILKRNMKFIKTMEEK